MYYHYNHAWHYKQIIIFNAAACSLYNLDEPCIVVLLSTEKERAWFRLDLCEREKADEEDYEAD